VAASEPATAERAAAEPAIVGAREDGQITIESGPDAGQAVRIGEGGLRAGRSPDNDLVLRDPASSGRHARFERRGDAFYVVDLGSTNGTLVRGEPVQERELKDGDEVTIGQNRIRFLTG
jgi:pSer/pThr/pTyr-binding forkhead associated (FHA) protein